MDTIVTGSQQPTRHVRPIHEQILESENSKNYMERKKIPEMFQSLAASLMMERPQDHLTFIEEKLEIMKKEGDDNINWETFIYHLHPMRDAVREKYVKDGKFEERKEKEKKKRKSHGPEVFELTETLAEDDDV